MSLSLPAICKSGFLVLGVLASGVIVGCGSEGEGTIKISNPAELRAKAGGGGGATENLKPKQAKAKAFEDEAAKKQPKLN